ncbi:hypothetical protein ACFYZ2_40595 [Streptomyces sviceus]|uniref:hypothetical protein n=1 Tax=Streptomyces sviceus TaxID=285530 RepID=UPI0036D1659A
MWEAGRKPDAIVLRSSLLQASEERSRLTRLVLPKGIALRFYLLALFEAQCRLNVRAVWENALPLSGRGSWSDMVAIDGAYDTDSATYMRSTVGSRKLENLRLQQIKGALRTLEELGGDNALVTMPRRQSGQREYQKFLLMNESGRGGNQTPDVYTVPAKHWSAVRTIAIPVAFFLNGWVQVLNPSEVATWLILRMLSRWAPKKHTRSGVYLYGQARLETFGLRDDAWEDGCQRLREFGLIRYAKPPDIPPSAPRELKELFSPPTRPRRRYEPHHWQVTDEGLDENAVKKLDQELTLRQQALDTAAKQRAHKTP